MRDYISLVLLCVVVALQSFCGVAHSAPDVAPDLPDGWCDRIFGAPTRTTGECICKVDCEGPRCVREQGFVFYSGVNCPSCKCVGSKVAQTNKSSSNGNAANAVQEDEEDARPINHRAQKKAASSSPNPNNDYEAAYSWQEFKYWAEDHHHVVFGTLAGVVMTVILGMMLLIAGGSGESTESKKVNKDVRPKPNKKSD